MTRIALIVLLLAPHGVLFAQHYERVDFEVVSIKPSQADSGANGGCQDNPGRSICRNMPLSNMISVAYGVPLYRVIAPDWSTTARFDLEVKLPEDQTRQQFPEMMRTMLVEPRV